MSTIRFKNEKDAQRVVEALKALGVEGEIESPIPQEIPETETKFDFDDDTGPVSAARHKNPDGSLGGWVAKTAHVEETAFVGPDARVYGDARVLEQARVYGNAQVFGAAKVFGVAAVFGAAKVCGIARVYGNAKVFETAFVSGNTTISTGHIC